MENALGAIDLAILPHLTQEYLEKAQIKSSAFVINYLAADEQITVLIEHSPPQLSEPDAVLDVIEQMLLDERILSACPVVLKLFTLNQQAYASRQLERTNTEADIDLVHLVSDDTDSSVERQLDPTSTEIPSLARGEVQSASDQRQLQTQKRQLPKRKVNFARIGALVAILAGFTYTISRPCVVSRCQPIVQTKQLVFDANQAVEASPSAAQVVALHEQLTDNMQQLKAVPVWSINRQPAKDAWELYQPYWLDLDRIVKALDKGGQAASQAQNPPFNLTTWTEIQQLWQSAVDYLQAVPPQSNLYGFARDKLRFYRANLIEINNRLKQEEEAQNNLAAARETAKIAAKRQNIANTLSDWQSVYTTWNIVINRLENINKGTTGYDEGQELLKVYLPKMTVARDRKDREEFALELYNQGVRMAQEAKNSQSQDRWSNAVERWRNALDSIKQVPENSSQYNKAESLLDNYAKALEFAQEELQFTLKKQQADSTLKQACSGLKKICTFTIQDHIMQVRLNANYLQQIAQIALQSTYEEDKKTQAELIEHVKSLETALKAVSNQSTLPLEVYHADGALVYSYIPPKIQQ